MNKIIEPIKLTAASVPDARLEAQKIFPGGADLMGYDEDGESVYISTVREKGNTSPVATARRNRSKRAVRFTATPIPLTPTRHIKTASQRIPRKPQDKVLERKDRYING